MGVSILAGTTVAAVAQDEPPNETPKPTLAAMVPYIGALYQIVAAGQKTNSYKFALWRALARLAPVTNEAKPLISKSNLAPLHVEYYWPLEVK